MCCGIWPLLFLRGGACLSAVCRSRSAAVGERAGGLFGLAQTGHAYRTTASWIGGFGYWKSASVHTYSHVYTHTHELHRRKTHRLHPQHTHTNLNTHAYTHTLLHHRTLPLVDPFPDCFWNFTSCMYCADCMQAGRLVWQCQQTGNMSRDFWKRQFPPVLCAQAKLREREMIESGTV